MMHSLRLKLIAVTTVLPLLVMGAAFVLISKANAQTFRSAPTFSTVAGSAAGLTGDAFEGSVSVSTLDRDPRGSGVATRGPGSGGADDYIVGSGPVCAWPLEQQLRLISADVQPLDATTAGAFVYQGSGDQAFAVAAAPQFIRAFEADKEESLYDLNLQVAGVIGSAGLLCGVLGFVASQRIIVPVSALTRAARGMEGGDLEQRVRYEGRDEVGQLSHAFNAMAESLERTHALRQTMTSDIAHELRTPLNNIAGFVDMLSDGLVEPDERVLATLQEETQLLVRLVDDLEQLSLGDAGQLRLEMAVTSLRPPAERALQAMQAVAEERGVTLELTDDGSPEVNLDSSRFDQVLRNLLENATRHTPAGGHVTLTVGTEGADATLTVSDTGSGIDPEHLPNIFERFYRADSSRTRRTGGSGLGLAITRQIVEAHGGTISARNRLEGGAEFLVRLPAAAGTGTSSAAAR